MKIRILSLIFFALLLHGCAGSQTRLGLDEVTVPVSMTGYLYDKDFKIIPPGKMKNVDTISFTKKRWATLWGFVPLHGHDYSKEINNMVSQANGDAVVNFTVGSRNTCQGWNMAWIFLDWLPVWPGCSVAVVNATIVEVAP
jgi:hypothetical protein